MKQEEGIISGHKSRDKEQCQNNRKGEGKDGSWSKFKNIKYCLSPKTYFYLFLEGDSIVKAEGWKNSGSKFNAIVLCVLLINSMRLNFFSWTKFFIWLLQIFFKTFQPFISGDIISVWCLKRIKNEFSWNGLKLFRVFESATLAQLSSSGSKCGYHFQK